MADQRVLDDSENEKGTESGVTKERDLSNGKLGHILEDISLDEWDVSADSNVTSEAVSIPSQNSPTTSTVSNAAHVAEEEETSSLFSFSLMKKFGEDADSPQGGSDLSQPSSDTPSDGSCSQPDVSNEATSTYAAYLARKSGGSAADPAPTNESTPVFDSAPAPPVDLSATPISVAVPEPPKAVGPNPFLFQATRPKDPLLTDSAVSANPPVADVTEQTQSPVPTVAAVNPSQGKRKPAATLIFDSFTKSKIGLDLLDPFNIKPPTTPSPTDTSPTDAPSTGAVQPTTASTAAPPDAKPTKERKTARTLIFKKGMSADGLDPTFEALMPAGLDPATSTGTNPVFVQNPTTTTGTNPVFVQNPTTTTGTNPVFAPNPTTATGDNPASGQNPTTATSANPASGQNPTTVTGANPAIGQNQGTVTGTNQAYTANPSVGPNLAAAIAAANPLGLSNAADSAVARHNSNVIPAHNPTAGGRPIARTMILKSLAPPEDDEPVELFEEALTDTTSNEPSILNPEGLAGSGQTGSPAGASAQPKFAKRATAKTLTFKAFTMPTAEENAKPAPLKIVRYDSSKLRNMERDAKPLSIAESLAAVKQASITAAEDKNDRRPLWLKTIAAHPLVKSPMFRSAVLLIVLSIALLVCSSALIHSLYSDGDDYRPSNVTTTRDQRHFKSTDGARSFELSDKGSVLISNGKAIHGKIKSVNDGELFSLAMAPAAKREIWLQKTDAGYVDQDGITLYGAGAPELQIAKKIDSYASLVAAKYKETKIYPSDVERLERLSPRDFHYTNPFTGKSDQPSVQYKRFAAADPTWTDHTRQAHTWQDEPPWKPGAIHCMCLDYCRFFIRGFDRSGRPLFGSTPGVADYIELKDGNNMNPRRVDKVVDDKDKTPATFMVARNAALSHEVAVLRQIGPLFPVLLVVVALAVGGWLLFLRRMKNNKADSTANMTKFTMKE